MSTEEHWIPDHEDGSGWAPVDWGSVIMGTRYHYRHASPRSTAHEGLPAYYRVVTRLESAAILPHENTYYVPNRLLADFLAELAFLGGAETVWHVEPCADPPPEAFPDP